MATSRRTTVPVLTEVLAVQATEVTAAVPQRAEAALAPPWPGESRGEASPAVQGTSDAADLPSETQLAARVLEDLHRQVDLMIEHQLQQTLEGVLHRLTHDFAAQARDAVHEALHDVVQRAVRQELERTRVLLVEESQAALKGPDLPNASSAER